MDDSRRPVSGQPAVPDSRPANSEGGLEPQSDGNEETGVRALYKRLAREYQKRPFVPDHGGGLPGDRYPF